MTQKTGARVVCIDDAFPITQFLREIPVANSVYAVRGCIDGIGPDGEPMRGLLLEGVYNPPSPGGTEHAFNASRFRPATDISCFKEILERPMAPSA